MSLAAWVLFFAVIWPKALLTPPRQVCSVSMPTPCTNACSLVEARAELVRANWFIVEVIDDCNALRLPVVTALTNRVTDHVVTK